jgi:hypothetical protein
MSKEMGLCRVGREKERERGHGVPVKEKESQRQRCEFCQERR